jgi:hypothetical protein
MVRLLAKVPEVAPCKFLHQVGIMLVCILGGVDYGLDFTQWCIVGGISQALGGAVFGYCPMSWEQ